MPLQKSQLHRLMRIAALLKENRYPNSESLVREFRRMALEDELEIDCCKKTVLRDMKVLENEFGCPLAFDRSRNGYYLKYHTWEFVVPALLDENEMLAAVLGARLAEAIFPAPLKNRVRNAVDYLLQHNMPVFLETANMGSLSVLSGLYTDLDPEIFMTVFQGWQSNRCLRITYADNRGNISERDIEPHTLVFYNNSWYTKAYCLLKGQPRTFSLQRIQSAELMQVHFYPEKSIIDSVTPEDFLSFAKTAGVRLKVTARGAERLAARPLHSGQVIGSGGIAYIPAVAPEILFPFLLSLQGEAELIEPASLREEFKENLQNMLKVYQ